MNDPFDGDLVAEKIWHEIYCEQDCYEEPEEEEEEEEE